MSGLEESSPRQDTTAAAMSVSSPAAAAADALKLAETKADNCGSPTVVRSVRAVDRCRTGMCVCDQGEREGGSGLDKAAVIGGAAAPL